MVSQLLYDLPASERTASSSWKRDLDEMLVSQEKMLKRLNKPVGPRDAIERLLANTFAKRVAWLAGQPNLETLFVVTTTWWNARGRGRAVFRVPRGGGRRPPVCPRAWTRRSIATEKPRAIARPNRSLAGPSDTIARYRLSDQPPR